MKSNHWIVIGCCLPLLLLILIVFAYNPQGTECITSCHEIASTPAVAQEYQISLATNQVPAFFANLLDTSNWPARWNCGIWSPFHGWLYIISDIVIWFSYFMIPLILGFYLLRKREAMPFPFVLFLFIAFILACGLTHLIDVVIFWWPAYKLSALMRSVTAIISIGTVFALIKVTPKVLEFKSPKTLEKLVSKLTVLNQQLLDEVNERKKAQNELSKLNESLEKIVEQRTVDLKNSNENLKKLNDLFVSTQEAANVGSWEIDLKSDYIFCSKQVNFIHDISTDVSFNMKTAINFIHPDYREMIEADIEKAVATGEKYDKEIKLITAKKRVIWVRVVGLPIVKNGQTVALRGLLMDINDIRTTQQKVKDNERILALALEAGEAGVYNWDIKKDKLEWDNCVHRLFDYPKKHFKGKFENLLERIHPDDFEAVDGKIDDLLEKGTKLDITFRILTRKKDVRNLHFKGLVYRDHTGNAQQLVGLCLNITREKKREQSLRESEQRFKAAFDFSPIGVALISLEGALLKVNSALSELLGFTIKNFPYTSLQEMTHTKDRGLEGKKMQQVQNGEIKSYQLDKRYTTSGKNEIWVQQNISVVRSADKKPLYFIGQVLDITERKMAEQKTQAIVKQRTAQLEATNKELEAFSYSVSHDLRSPLRSIHGFSQALLEDYSEKLDSIGKNYLTRVSLASIKMGVLIDDLLGLSKINRKEFDIEELDITAMALEVAENLQLGTYNKTQFIIAPHLKAFGDKGLLNIALQNLLENAAKYSRSLDQPKVEMGITTVNDQQVFYIKDNGVGFDMAYADKLFGAFQRLHTTKDFEGTGIGLATVKRIVHRHEGEIWAESTVNGGSTFCFTLKIYSK